MRRKVPEGARVQVTHERIFKLHVGDLYPQYFRIDQLFPDETRDVVSPTGGRTTVSITFKNTGGLTITATAKCRHDDAYVKSIGRNIALGRALKLYEEHYEGSL